MTREDKELLLKDLCSRLPYEVKCQYHHIQEMITDILIDINRFGRVNIDGHIKDICDVKPYLFPLSSMTEEQWKEYQTLKMTDWVEGDINGVFINAGTITDWLNKNHFDYRGLISRGFAIDATNLNIY